MTPFNPTKYLVVAAVIVTGSVANADPYVVGNTSIGTDPGYGTGYSAFWRNGYDYALLESSLNTYVNAPKTSGALIFRGNNNGAANRECADYLECPATPDPDGGLSWAWLTKGGFNVNGGLTVSGSVYFSGWDTYVGQELDVAGSAYFEGNLFEEGTPYKVGGGSWAAWSDQRLKRDIVGFAPGLSDVMKVRPVRYKYNGLGGTEDTGKEYIGVIAQELESVAPYMVQSTKKKIAPSDKEDSDVLSVDPSAFTYMLINAVQELADQNHKLAHETAQLRALVCKDHPRDAICSK